MKSTIRGLKNHVRLHVRLEKENSTTKQRCKPQPERIIEDSSKDFSCTAVFQAVHGLKSMLQRITAVSCTACTAVSLPFTREKKIMSIVFTCKVCKSSRTCRTWMAAKPRLQRLTTMYGLIFKPYMPYMEPYMKTAESADLLNYIKGGKVAPVVVTVGMVKQHELFLNS